MTSVINPTRSAKLDVIRGVAILAVVAVHSFQASVGLFPVSLMAEASKTFVAFSYLRFGVELFFLLSGWLIFSIHRGNRRESGKQYLATVDRLFHSFVHQPNCQLAVEPGC